MRRVGDDRSGPEGGSNHHGLGHTRLARVAAADTDAIRALRREGHRYGDQGLNSRGFSGDMETHCDSKASTTRKPRSESVWNGVAGKKSREAERQDESG